MLQNNQIKENSHTKNQRIVKNTLLLYVRMILVMGVSIYTSRIILKALGFEDYGLYNVIGGFVGLFSVISGSLSTAISRYITFELGTENEERLRKVFACANIIQIIICLIVVLIALTFGLWFINSKMKIPNGDYISAYWIFGFSVASFCLTLMSVPYNAAIIAHEKMSVFAYISLLEVILKLGISFLVNVFTSYRLIMYALMIFVVSNIIRTVYVIYCKRNFSECSSRLILDKQILYEIGKFAGWNFIGSASGTLRSQGNNVLLNIFYGSVINAAYGICMQVNNAVNQLSNNFMTAVNPQIIKLYASGDLTEMNKLITRSAKISFFLCWIIVIIILLNTHYILQLWLGDVPEYTDVFVDLVLILLISESISNPLYPAMLATGDIRNYQIIVGGIQMLNLPISYVALKLGFKPPCVIIIAIILSQLCFAARLYMLRRMIKISVRKFLGEVYLRCWAVAALTYICAFMVKYVLRYLTFSTFMLEEMAAVSFSVVIIYWIGFNTNERIYLAQAVEKVKSKILHG